MKHIILKTKINTTHMVTLIQVANRQYYIVQIRDNASGYVTESRSFNNAGLAEWYYNSFRDNYRSILRLQ